MQNDELEKLYIEYRDKLKKYLDSKYKNEMLSEEIIQEVFLHLPEAKITKPINNTYSYLKKACNHKYIDLYRKEKAQKNREKNYSKDNENYIKNLGNNTISKREVYKELFSKYGEQLRPSYKYVCNLYYIEGKKCKDISEISGKSVQNIKTILCRARKKLKQFDE